MKQPLLQCAFPLLAILVVAVAVFFLLNPEVFPARGFSGPEAWRTSPPAGIRFSGDSWRYIGGAEQVLQGLPLDATQRGYRGYIYMVAACFHTGIGLRGLIALQIASAIGLLACLMRLACKAGDAWASVLAGCLFALNLDAAVWETFVMTEAFYSAAVGCLALLITLAACRRCWWTYAGVALATVLSAFLRPTGWILLPAAALFWIWNSGWKLAWRAAATLTVLLLFLAIAFGTGGARSGIEGQGPVQKLYSGEVVWQEDLWRVDMPPAPEDDKSFSSAAGYILHHPLACTWLALKRIGVLFCKVRPGYSLAHNAMLLAFYLPLALLAAIGFFLGRQSLEIRAVFCLVVAHALVVALTFNDNDGRFTLYIAPLLSVAAALPLKRLFLRHL